MVRVPLVYSNVMELRSLYKDAFLKKHGVKLGFMSAFVRASAFALTDQPVVNAVIDGGDIVYRDYVDISIAVSTPKVRGILSMCTLQLNYTIWTPLQQTVGLRWYTV